ncbi:hypothetical protein BS47DRAFT_1364687 [Hydnum rufescens UP504]|uniref:Uncharacterized protein n=1 Tax=Hydnum rufescens UP504 TaxID=1448309 RepID=A0A9P6ARD2_9AGAM|nr:hypothetical protein BS47DRAFT_1364687 [Hydnum rufescens UP504]
MPTQCHPPNKHRPNGHPPNKTAHTTPAKAGHCLNQKPLDEHMPNEPPSQTTICRTNPRPMKTRRTKTHQPHTRCGGHCLNEPPLPNGNPPNEQPPNEDLPNQNPPNEGPTRTTHPLRRATI